MGVYAIERSYPKVGVGQIWKQYLKQLKTYAHIWKLKHCANAKADADADANADRRRRQRLGDNISSPGTWSRRANYCLNLNLYLDLDSAHHLNTLNSWPMFQENPIRVLRYGVNTHKKYYIYISWTSILKSDWFWPSLNITEMWVLHIFSICWSFDSYFKTRSQKFTEIFKAE